MGNIFNNNSQKANLELHNLFPDIVFKSEIMAKLLDSVAKIAMKDVSVLITGDSGTGKELIARAIHNNSDRRNNTFIAVNCGAIAETLIESELFGHEIGSFTGATRRQLGKFEQANGGTLFLDEVGELSQNAQVKLLRVIQEGNFERLGGTETINVNIRLVTATNRDLEHEMKEGKFREDLYYRINVIPIHLSPLRERKEDIPLLIEYFRGKYNTKEKCVISIQDDVIETLIQYHWPGNVRELKNVMQRIMAMASGNEISMDDIPPYILDNNNHQEAVTPAVNQEVQNYRKLVDWILEGGNYDKGTECEGQIKDKAKQLNIWSAKQGIAGIGRSLIRLLSTHLILFEDINRESIKNIFNLLFLLAPSFKKEKADSVENLLNKWPKEKITCSPAEESILIDSKEPETFISRPKSLDDTMHPITSHPIMIQDKTHTKSGLSEEDIKVLIGTAVTVFVLIYLVLIFYSPETWLMPIAQRIYDFFKPNF